MPTSLVRFSDRLQHSNGKKLYWNRVHTGSDPYPYRGPHAPMMTEDEYEAKVVRVADTRNGFFDVTDKAENALYLEVLECCFNGWFQLIHQERFWVDPSDHRTTLHYLEWAEWYLEDGSRTPYLTNGITELAHGQQNLLGNPGAG